MLRDDPILCPGGPRQQRAPAHVRPGQSARPGFLTGGGQHLLVLPELGKAVPAKVTVCQGAEDLTAIALALAQEGWLTLKDLEGATHLLPVITTAIDRWCRKETRGLQYKVKLLFTDDWPTHFTGNLCENVEDDEETTEKDIRHLKGAFALDTSDSCAQSALIGPRLTELELHEPGLGRSVCRILQQTLGNIIHAYGPDDAIGDCQGWQWGGESDHRMTLEEWMDGENHEYEPFDLGQAICGTALLRVEWNHIADESRFFGSGEMLLEFHEKWDVRTFWLESFDFSESIITREEVDEHLPTWTWAWMKKPFSPRKLRDCSRRLPRKQPRLRKIVRAAADLWQRYQQFKSLDVHRNFYLIAQSPAPLVMWWSQEKDVVSRFYDERCNMAAQCGEYTDVCNIWVFDKDSAKSCRRMIRNVTEAFSLLREAERLLNLVAAKYWRHDNN